jgi:hypothetical protein
MTTVHLIERARSGFSLRVDENAGVLRGVKLLGLKSGNGREYLAAGLAAAAHLYEGRPVYANHRQNSRAPRRIEDKVGWISDVRSARGGLFADLHLLKSHPLTARIFESARRQPALFQMSHDAVGRERPGSRGSIIEGIVSVSSVDVVAEAATVHSLWEGLSGWPPAVSRRAAALGLLEAPGQAPPADADAQAVARAAEVRRLRNFRPGVKFIDCERRAHLIERLRRVRSPSGGGVLPLQEQLDVNAARGAEVRRLRSIR